MGMQKGEHYDAHYRRHRHRHCHCYPCCSKAKEDTAEDGRRASRDAHKGS